MFWTDKGGIELVKKNLFTAKFIVTNQNKLDEVTKDKIEGWNGTGNPEIEKNFTLLVKKIDAPSMNIGFERGLANNYVHYFQQGEINWEPITVTFIDAISLQNNRLPNWKKIFFDYSNKFFRIDNRTGVLDLPIFCNFIVIESKVTSLNNKETDSLKEQSKLLSTHFSIHNPRITKISFGSYDYASDDANEITVTFIPEWCSYDNSTDEIKDNAPNL